MSKYALIVIIIIMMIIMTYIKWIPQEVKYEESDIDGIKYLVRDLPDSKKAANMLGKIRDNLIKLSDHMNNNKDTIYKDYNEYIERLHSKIKYIEISESSPDSIYTSYSVNKGEQIVFCVREKNIMGDLHDINLVMYVALHEIAHVASPEYGHTELFKKIFAKFTEIGIKIGIYTKIDFAYSPVNYCGLTITDSII